MGYVGEVSDGAFAEFIDLPAGRLLAVPRGLPFNIAALAEPLAVALRVVRRLDPPRGTPIVIAGAGSVGGLAAVLLQHLGFGPLAIIDRNQERAALVASVAGARIIGADPTTVKQFTGAGGLGYAIEASGSPALFSFLVNTLAGGGRLAMVGIFSGEPPLNANAVVEHELDIRGCSVFCGEQREVLPMLSALESKLERIISPPITLEQMPREYEHLLSGRSAFLKSIVEP